MMLAKFVFCVFQNIDFRNTQIKSKKWATTSYYFPNQLPPLPKDHVICFCNSCTLGCSFLFPLPHLINKKQTHPSSSSFAQSGKFDHFQHNSLRFPCVVGGEAAAAAGGVSPL